MRPIEAIARPMLRLLAITSLCGVPPILAGSPFIYSSPTGITYEISEDGLSCLRIGDREIAKGEWRILETNLPSFAAKPSEIEFSEKEIEQLTHDHVRVRHRGKDVVATFDYAFRGEDVRIAARVENNRSDVAIPCSVFGGLTFFFDRTPEGWMISQSPNWLTAHAATLRGFHPSFEARLGGSYAIDSGIGIGVTPVGEGLAPTGIFWWPDPKSPQARRLVYAVPAPIPPGGARTFELQLRVSANRDWRNLLEPYKEQFNATFGASQPGAVHYKADYRPFCQAVLADRESVSNKQPTGIPRAKPPGRSRRKEHAASATWWFRA